MKGTLRGKQSTFTYLGFYLRCFPENLRLVLYAHCLQTVSVWFRKAYNEENFTEGTYYTQGSTSGSIRWIFMYVRLWPISI